MRHFAKILRDSTFSVM